MPSSKKIYSPSYRSRQTVLRFAAVAVTLTALIATGTQMWVSLEREKQAELERENFLVTSRMQLRAAEEEIDRLQAALEEMRRHAPETGVDPQILPADPASAGVDPQLAQLLSDLRRKVSLLESSHSALREALDPTTEEALTLMRLKDRVIALEDSRGGFEGRLGQQFERFERSVEQRLQASGDSVRWLFVVLIPLVLNFLYTVWKDWRSDRKKTAEVRPSAPSSE